MKHVSEYAPYAEAIAARDELQAALNAARARHVELTTKLANRDQGALPPNDPLAVAMQVARGERPDARVAVSEQWQRDEMELRVAIERLERGLAAAVEKVGLEQQRARNAAFRSRAPAIAKIRADWLRGCHAMQKALEAEDAVLAELVEAGFGCGEAIITRPHEHLVGRERLRDVLEFEPVRVGEMNL